jgi:hypothetical protein
MIGCDRFAVQKFGPFSGTSSGDNSTSHPVTLPAITSAMTTLAAVFERRSSPPGWNSCRLDA